ncbi:GntR family transcriptional regulator [Halomonas organivorans]
MVKRHLNERATIMKAMPGCESFAFPVVIDRKSHEASADAQLSPALPAADQGGLIDAHRGGGVAPGTFIPSESALAKECGVSVGILRKALDALASKDVVIRYQGKTINASARAWPGRTSGCSQ